MLAGVAWLALPLALGSCGVQAGAEGVAGLRTGLLRAARVEVHVEPGDLEDACRRAAERRSPELDGYAMEVVHRSRGRASAARVLVGTPDDPWVRELATRAGCVSPIGEGGGAGFRFAGRVFEGGADLFIACFEDPERPGLPVCVWLGNDARELASLVESLGTSWFPHARVLREGEALLELDLALDGAPLGEPERGAGAMRAARLSRSSAVELPEVGLSLRVVGALPTGEARAYGEACAAARARLHAWLAPEEVLLPVTLALWTDLDLWIDLPPQGGLSCVPGSSGLLAHALFVPGLPTDGGAAAARAAALAHAGSPIHPWLADAAAFEAADVYWGRALDSWVGPLAAAGLVPEVRELVDPRATERLSPHVILPARALFLRWLIEAKGAPWVRELWVGALPAPDPGELEAAFAPWLAARWAPSAPAHEAQRQRRRLGRESLGAPGSLTGFALETSLVEGASGLGSHASAATIAATAGAGARALGVTTFLVAGRPVPRRLGPDQVPVLEPVGGDAALALALSVARAQGLSTMLLPELIAGPGGTLAGDLLRGPEEHWLALFDELERELVHHALLAELGEVDVLALAAAIPAVADYGPSGWRAPPEEQIWKRAGWARLIASVRGGFGGALTYVAAGPEELGLDGFASELDLLAFELFPLAPSELADAAAVGALDERIGFALDSARATAQALGKPVLLARYGLPGEVPRGRAGELQRIGLAALERALAKDRSLAGVMLWRLGLDPLEPPLGPSDPLLRPSVMDEARALVRRFAAPR